MTDGSSRRPKQYVVERVRNLLAIDPRVGELDIHVKVLDDRLFVTGTVPTPERRDVITEVLRDALPEYEVNNELSVVEPVERTGEEQLS
jgi:hypothetical protein